MVYITSQSAPSRRFRPVYLAYGVIVILTWIAIDAAGFFVSIVDLLTVIGIGVLFIAIGVRRLEDSKLSAVTVGLSLIHTISSALLVTYTIATGGSRNELIDFLLIAGAYYDFPLVIAFAVASLVVGMRPSTSGKPSVSQ